MFLRLVTIAFMVMLASCATMGEPTPHPNIYVMRHLHTPEGASDPDLTAEGFRYAEAVSRWFRRDPPDVIYVSSTRRAQQTAAVLATRLKLTPKIYDARDTPGLLGDVMKEPGTVLIVGHSNTVPDIVAGLGGPRPGPLVHQDFGDVWHVSGPQRTTRRDKLSL